MLVASLHDKYTQLQPEVKKWVVAGILVTSVATLVALIWGRVALAAFAGLVFCAWYFSAPAHRFWKHAEIKGVALAVVAAVVPFLPFGGVAAAGYLSSCILYYQWQQIQILSSLEDVQKAQEGQIGQLEKEKDASLQRLEKLKTIFNSNTIDEMIQTLDYFQETLKNNPQQQALKKAIERFVSQGEAAEKDREELRLQIEALRKQREALQQTNTAFSRHERERSDITEALQQIVTI